LTDEELIIVGRISLMWGHIDTNLDQIIMSLLEIGFKQFDSLFSGKLVGPKCDAVMAHSINISDAEVIAALQVFVASAKDCLTERNTLAHGLWGWEWTDGTWASTAFSRSKNQTFRGANLRQLHEKIQAASVAGDVALQKLGKVAVVSNSRNRPFVITSGEDLKTLPQPPQGFAR
jgi:hypothetical protein